MNDEDVNDDATGGPLTVARVRALLAVGPVDEPTPVDRQWQAVRDLLRAGVTLDQVGRVYRVGASAVSRGLTDWSDRKMELGQLGEWEAFECVELSAPTRRPRP